ncbi:MAG TPA: leucine-rich repeat domain-containing protein, partial [Candidatus Phocaeicola gallistercoris]|nr:leucine-rich repeat domain-containing protein [Candidatus Phocaeicola gallistercoris]
VVLPDALTSLGKEAFSGCSALSSLTIGTALTELNLTSIKDCPGLKEVIFKDSETPIVVDGSGVNTPYNIEAAHIGRDISVVTNVFGLYGLFQNCTTLRNVTIGDNVTALCDYAFDGCTNVALNKI